MNTEGLEDLSYKSWKQFGESWSNISIGNSTIARSGCAVVSLAMLCVHSGSVSIDGFDPGVFANGMKSLGAFTSDGGINWSAINKYTSNLSFEKSINSGYSSQSATLEAIKGYLNSGYYVVARVNNSGSTHFVLVDYVTDSKIYMMDPGKSSANELFATYGNITGLRLFKSTVGDPSTLITGGEIPVTPLASQYETPAEDTEDSDEDLSSSAAVVMNGTGAIVSAESSGYIAGDYTTVAALNFRSAPSTESEALCVIPKGTAVKVEVTTIDGWGRVTYNDKTGWICLRYVK
jgi:uncharacterized protein YgiM (DUF1202 family)